MSKDKVEEDKVTKTELNKIKLWVRKNRKEGQVAWERGSGWDVPHHTPWGESERLLQARVANIQYFF